VTPALAIALALACIVACGNSRSGKASPPSPCGVVPAVPATSVTAAEAAGAPGLWQFDGSTWAWLANEPPPGPRISDLGVLGGIAYDPGAAQLVHVNEAGTHLWNGQTWLDVRSDTGPSPRLDAQMVYDAARQEVVLFGGRDFKTNGTYLNDTWTWDGRVWHQQTPSSSPDFGFDSANMVWDDANRVVLLLGSIRDQGRGQVVSATWTWNGTNWHRVFPSASPPERFGATMAFDGGRGTAVLFGGFDVSPHRDYNDTWTWDGTTWAEHFPVHVPTTTPTDNGLPGQFAGGVSAYAMAYDPERKVVVLAATDAGVIKTWTWGGSDWTRLQTPISPRAASHMSMTYDTHAHRVLLVVFADPLPYYGPCQPFGVL
jgi:hypothetical protein